MAVANKKEVKLAQIIDGNLVITIPLSTPYVIATTSGNVKTDLEVEGKAVTIGVNAYVPNR